MFKPLAPSLGFYSLILMGDSKRRWLRLSIFALLIVVLASTSMSALAQSSGFSVLDPVVAKYQSFQFVWYAKIRVVAERLFWLLVGVDFAWSGVIYVLDKNTIEEIAISTVKKILTIGFFYSLLKFSDTWIPAIINSFAKIGTDAGNVVNTTPDGIAKTGYELALACFGAMKKLGMLDAIAVVFPVTFIAIVTLLAFLFVAAQLLVTLVESYLAIGAGVILLGFGGSRWTTDFATKYLQYAVGTGIKLMILYLIVGVGQTITADLAIDSAQLLQSCLQALGVAVVYGYLAIQIPAMASAMMSGSPSMTAGSLASTALTLGAAAAGAGAAAVGAAKAGAGGAGGAVAGAAGLGQALSAGLSSAADHGLSGMGAAMHATGEVVGQGMAMAAGGIGDAVAGGGRSFGDRVAQSTGGQIASQIEAGRGGSMQGINGNSGANNAGAPAPSSASTSSTSGASSSGPSTSGAASSGASASGESTSAASTSGQTESSASTSGAASASALASGAETAGSVPSAGSDGSGASSAGSQPAAASTSNLGNATGAQIGPSTEDVGNGSGAGNVNGTDNQSGAGRDPLHSQIRDLQGFVPSDAAHSAGIQLDLKHSQD